MKISKYKIILVLAFVLVGCYVSAGKDYFFLQKTIENGLSQSFVNSICCDRNGGLWIGTKSGLNYFDRYEYKNYYHESDVAYSLPGNFIYLVTQDSLSNVWVSTDNGLVNFDASKDQFIPAFPDKDVLIFSSLCLPGKILFGGNNCLYTYDYKNGSISPLPVKPEKQYMQYRKMVAYTNDSLLIQSKDNGLWWYSLDSNKLERVSFCDERDIMAVYVDSQSYIYVSSFKKGLMIYNKEKQLIKHLTSFNSGLNNDIILDILEKDGAIWLATDGGGINIVDKKDFSTFTHLMHITGDAGSLPVNSVTRLYSDFYDNLWAGSVRGGVLGIKEVFIKTYKDVPLGNIHGLSEKVVISMYEDEEQQLWIGTDGGGLNRFDSKTNTFRHYPNTYSTSVASVTGFTKNELLISLYSEGIFIFNKQNGTITPFTIIDPQVNASECKSGFTAMAYQVTPERIFILARNPYIYDTGRKEFIPVKSDVHPYYISALTLAYADDVASYMTKSNHLFRIDHNQDSLSLLLKVEPGEEIHAVSKDSKGRFWLGTSKGLKYFDSATGVIEKVDTRLFDNVSTLVMDKRDLLWIGARNMLFSYLINENRFVIWEESDGFVPNELLQMFPVFSSTGNVYLGGSAGFVKVNSDISFVSESDFYAGIMDVELNGKSQSEQLTTGKDAIRIPWNYSSLVIKVKTNEKDIFRKKLYRYQISGLTDQLIETYSHSLNLPMLSPGKYAVIVSFSTPSGEWSKPSEILSIDITPPWYRSKWVIGGVIGICLIVVIVIVFSVLKRKENKLKWRLKEHEQEAYEEKIRFLINVSHELRTPLTLIYAPVKRLLEQDRHSFSYEAQQFQLEGIYKQAHRMKDIVNMVLDVNKIQNKHLTLCKTGILLNTWLHSVAGDFVYEADMRHIELSFELDEAIREIRMDSDKCEIVLSNFLVNALKFSPENKQIILRSEIRGDSVRVSVVDEGIGLDNLDIDKLFTRFYQGKHDRGGSGIGLSYAKMLIELHGGIIGAYNNSEVGATFYFELPVKSDVIEPVIMQEFPNERSDTQEQTLLESGLTAPFPLSQYTVLVADDEPDLRSFLKETLKELFKTVIVTEDGERALELIREKLPDLVISDVMMPRMDGFTLCESLKNNLEISHIPVILLTARNDSESTTVGYKLGADAYVPKPFDMDFLLVVVRSLLKNRESVKSRYKKGHVMNGVEELTTSNADESFMIKMNDFVLKNLSNTELDVQLMMDALGVSRVTLYGKVKNLTGLTVNDYIIRIRIERACQLLLHTSMSVTEISEEVGFAYQRYFSTQFKLLKGMTPSQFRQEQKKE